MAKIAFIVDSMFEDSEFRVPYDRVKQAGHQAVIVAAQKDKPLEGKSGKERVQADAIVDDVSADDFDALVIPGGYSPDHLRMNIAMVRLTRDLFNAGKPLAAICHAGSMLVEADIADGHTLTSWPSIKTDLINAGARWVDQAVVEDGNLITSRKPQDLEAFTEALLKQLAQSGKAASNQPATSASAEQRVRRS
jgi:protease I